MFVVDTNILIHAAIQESSAHQRARAVVEEWLRKPEAWFGTWPILYEFLRVTTHRGIFRRPLRPTDAWSFVQALLASASFSVLVETERHPDILATLLAEHPQASGNFLHDLHTAALMQEHGITDIRTADTDFHRFKQLRVVNPLA